MAEVRLVDLEIIKRYSLAVRREKVPADELLAVIDASRAAVVAAMGTPSPSSSKGRRARAAQAAGSKKPAAAGRAAAQRAPAADPGPDPHADRDVIDEVAS